MKYTYTEYKDPITEQVLSITRSDGASIPCDPANSDYQQYLNPTEHLQTIVPMEGAN